ncbi:hypothetical protein CFP56_021277 [Quercus suber]|uniref:Post-SET domain-containing protein n=1 Tax=Quercus suber TaxID=58331 RepID=A0AAW0KFL6_QUESU
MDGKTKHSSNQFFRQCKTTTWKPLNSCQCNGPHCNKPLEIIFGETLSIKNTYISSPGKLSPDQSNREESSWM